MPHQASLGLFTCGSAPICNFLNCVYGDTLSLSHMHLHGGCWFLSCPGPWMVIDRSEGVSYSFLEALTALGCHRNGTYQTCGKCIVKDL